MTLPFEWKLNQENRTVWLGTHCCAEIPRLTKSTPTSLTLLTTPDRRYAAIYDTTGVYCEIHEQTDDGYSRYLFTLKRDTYHQTAFLVAFWATVDGWCLIFNERHGCLSVFQLPMGERIADKLLRDEFLGQVTPILHPILEPGRYFSYIGWIHGWPGGYPGIIDVAEVAGDRFPEVHPLCWQFSDRTNRHDNNNSDDDNMSVEIDDDGILHRTDCDFDAPTLLPDGPIRFQGQLYELSERTDICLVCRPLTPIPLIRSSSPEYSFR